MWRIFRRTPPRTVDASFFKPFDITYSEVTALMHKRASELRVPEERAWLISLIDQFAGQRYVWLTSRQLEVYRRACTHLRSPVLRLVAGAYLHVAYDLPRVLADNWPGGDRWSHGPQEDHAEFLYFDLAEIFPNVLLRIARRRAVLGSLSLIALIVPRESLEAASTWLMYLREGAWRYGHRLHSRPTDRDRTEQLMLLAMAAALTDVVDSRPWSAFLLTTPNVPPSGDGTARQFVPPLVLSALADWLPWALLGSAVVLGLLSLRRRGRATDEQMARFVDDFGRRLSRYLEYAFEDPERLLSLTSRVDRSLHESR